MLRIGQRRPRILAFSAAAAATGALLAVPSAATAGPPAPVTFSAAPATAPLLAHYTVDQRAASTAARAGSATETATALGARRTSVAGKRALRHQAGRTAPVSAQSAVRGAAPSAFAARARLRASFPGMQSSVPTCSYFAGGCNPPDMAIAASSRWVLQGVNTSFEVLDTRGHVQAGWPRKAQAFFGVPNEPNNCDPDHLNQPFMSDPRAFYDPSTGRFWAAMLQVENTIGIAPNCPYQGVYYVAVSQTSDPRGRWNVYKFDMSGGVFGAGTDFTMLGFDSHAVYFSSNVFNQEGTAYLFGEIYEANKAMMEHGQAHFTAAGFKSMTVTGPAGAFLADTVQPVQTLSPGAGGEYFVDTFNGFDPVSGNDCSSAAAACRGLALWRFDNPTAHDFGGPAPTLHGAYVNTLPYAFPPPADQPGCTQCIDANDLRIGATPVFRNGRVYAAWGTGLNNGTQVVPAVETAVIAAHAAVGRSSYYVFGGDIAAIYPVVMPDGAGRVVMLYDRMSSSIFPETRVVVSDDGIFRGAGILLKAGEAPYRPGVCGTAALPVCRWGDYSAASSNGHGTVWVAGQYSNGNVGPSTDPTFSSRNWGTWIGAVRADD
jgi:hypothetical protein